MMAVPLLLAAALMVQADTVNGRVEGRVFNGGGAARATLADARVELSVGPWTQTAYTDSAGAYWFDGVGKGSHFLTAWRAGYDTARVEVIVPRSGSVRVDLTLHERPIVLAGIDVYVDESGRMLPLDSVRPRGRGNPTDPFPRALEPRFAESGMVDWARTMLGNPTKEPGDVLYMRGSASDLKLVLLDGAPVYTPFHVGGLIPSFDASVLESGALHVGAAPVRYDGGLSYIMDLRVREPESRNWRGRASLDLVSGGGALEGPLGSRGGLVLSGRALHPFVNNFLGDGASPYGYGDLLARSDFRVSDSHKLSLTGFWNNESVALDFPMDVAQVYGSDLPSAAAWGNGMASLGYQGNSRFGEVSGRASLSQYTAELPFEAEVPSFLRGVTQSGKVGLQLTHPLSDGRLRIGGDADLLSVDYSATEVGTSLRQRTRSRAITSTGALYAELDRPLGPNVRLRAGARLSAFPRRDFRLAPRLSVNWLFSENAVLSVAAGRYHQLTPFTDDRVASALGLSPPSDLSFESVVRSSTFGHLLGVASATHFLVSLDQQLPGSTRLGVETFYKKFEDLGRLGESLKASGLDLRIRKGGDRLEGWMGYSLSWFWTDNLTDTDPFAGRHLLSAGVIGDVFGRGDIDVRLSYGQGLPFTTVPLGSTDALTGPGPAVASSAFETATTAARGDPPLTGGPSGEFLRVDAEISTDLNVSWWGRQTSVRPYVKVLNALDRRDALFYYFEPWRDGDVRPLAELSLLPVLGVEWTF